MIWFKLEIINGNEVSDSKLITAKVTELLGTKEVLYTGSHEINEQEIVVEERFWREYGEWEFDLLAEALEEQEPLEVDGAEVIVIYTVEEKKVLQLSSDDLPVWYIKAQ
tara:strand:+ start:623 stop:949 length:327 start_codon:yes stop_codon:yes gene_type:complete